MKTSALLLLAVLLIASVHSQFTGITVPSFQIEQCVINRGVSLQGCSLDVLDLCPNSNCRATLEPVYEECGFDLAQTCRKANLQLCYRSLSSNQRAELNSACGDVLRATSALCGNMTCVEVATRVFGECGYDVLDNVCRSSAAAGVYGFPMLLLASTLFTMLH